MYSELTVRLVEKVTVGVWFCLSFCLRRYSSSRASSSTTRRTSTTMPLIAPHDSRSPGGRGTMTLPDNTGVSVRGSGTFNRVQQPLFTFHVKDGIRAAMNSNGQCVGSYIHGRMGLYPYLVCSHLLHSHTHSLLCVGHRGGCWDRSRSECRTDQSDPHCRLEKHKTHITSMH